MNHNLLKFSCYIYTLILLLSVVLSILFHGTKNRHSFGVPHIVVIKSVIVCFEDHGVSSRYFINHYKYVYIRGVVYNTIIIL